MVKANGSTGTQIDMNAMDGKERSQMAGRKGMAYRRYPQELKDKVILEYLGGKSSYELHKKYGMTAAVIRYWVINSGRPMRARETREWPGQSLNGK